MRMLAAFFMPIPLLIAGCKKQSQHTVSSDPPAVTQFAASQPAKNTRAQQAPIVAIESTAASNSAASSVAELPGRRVLIEKSGTLFLTNPTGMSQRKISDEAGAAALSPDGTLVAYADNKGVHVLSLVDGQSVTIANLTEGRVNSLAWSPDQRSVAYDLEVRMKGWTVSVASYSPSGPPRNLGHWYETLSFSADGKFIVHPGLDTTHRAKGFLETVNVETGKRETIYMGTNVIWDAQYSPDGSRIAFVMTRPDPNAANASDDDVDCSMPDRDLWVLHLDSKKAERIMANVFDFAWSPDGRLLAVETGTQDCGYPPGDAAVFISSSDGKVQFQLSKNAPSIGARFSPDSKQVMFLEFDASSLVIGDLATRNLTSQVDSSCAGGGCSIYGWK